MYWTQRFLGKFGTKNKAGEKCCSFLLECNLEASWSDDFDMDVLGEMHILWNVREIAFEAGEDTWPAVRQGMDVVTAFLASFLMPLQMPGLLPRWEKVCTGPQRNSRDGLSRSSFSVDEKLIHYGHGAERISCHGGSRTCTIYVGLERVRLPSTVSFCHEKFQQKMISCSLFLYWDWFLSGHDIWYSKCYKSMFLRLATSESWWISMGLRSLTIGKMLEDQSGRQQAQWGSPVRAVWFVLLMWRSCCATNGVLTRRKCSWVVIACSCVTCLHNPWTSVFFWWCHGGKVQYKEPKTVGHAICWRIVGHLFPWRVSMIWAYVH